MVVLCDGDGVHADCVADEVEVLSGVSDAVGAVEPEGVLEVPVDGLGVVTSRVEILEVRVIGWDGSDVLGAVEPAPGVAVVLVEPAVMVPPPTQSGSSRSLYQR